MYLAIWLFGYLAIQLFDYSTFGCSAIRLCGSAICLFGYLAIDPRFGYAALGSFDYLVGYGDSYIWLCSHAAIRLTVQLFAYSGYSAIRLFGFRFGYAALAIW